MLPSSIDSLTSDSNGDIPALMPPAILLSSIPGHLRDSSSYRPNANPPVSVSTWRAAIILRVRTFVSSSISSEPRSSYPLPISHLMLELPDNISSCAPRIVQHRTMRMHYVPSRTPYLIGLPLRSRREVQKGFCRSGRVLNARVGHQ